MKEVGGQVAALLAATVLVAVVLYYYLGSSTIIGAIFQGGSNLVQGYGALLKTQYPTAQAA